MTLAYQTLPDLFPASIQSLDIGLGIETYVRFEELPGLHIGSLYVLLQLAYHTTRVSDD